jgi:hypothetical protein
MHSASRVRAEARPASDTQTQLSTVTCNGTGCSGGWYKTGVMIALTATDESSGVAAIRYTLDGSEPTEVSTL